MKTTDQKLTEIHGELHPADTVFNIQKVEDVYCISVSISTLKVPCMYVYTPEDIREYNIDKILS